MTRAHGTAAASGGASGRLMPAEADAASGANSVQANITSLAAKGFVAVNRSSRHTEDLGSCAATTVGNRMARTGLFEVKSFFEQFMGLEKLRPFPRELYRGLYLWDFFVPNATCPDADRFGRLGDGGKWICGVQELIDRAARPDEACHVFSYGIGFDASFEKELLNTVRSCIVHAFDPGLGALPEILKPWLPGGAKYEERAGRPRLDWHKVGLGNRTGGVAASGSAALPFVESLADGMERLGLAFIDVLKVDIDGAEYDALIPLLEHLRPGVDPPPFGQLLLRMYVNASEEFAGNGTSANKVFRLVRLLSEHGYRIFAKEVSLLPIVEPALGGRPSSCEFGFIHPGAWERRRPGPLQLAQAGPPRHEVASAAPSPRHVVGGGVIYFLTHERRLHKLRKALEDLHNNFNRQFRYPVVVFHENISDLQQGTLQEEVVRGLYDLHFEEVSELFHQPLPVPPGMESLVPERCRCSTNSSSIGYRRMIYFQAFLASKILHEQFGFEWIWRLDDDSSLTAPVGYDPFQLMAHNGWRYGTVATVGDEPGCIEGLWELASGFVANRTGLLPHGSALFDQLPPGTAMYNNFEISHFSVWESPVYSAWSQAVLQHGGIFTRRWGDAVIRAIGVALALAPREVHYFTDMGYYHGLLDQQAAGLATSALRRYWMFSMGSERYPIAFHATGPLRYTPLIRFRPEPLALSKEKEEARRRQSGASQHRPSKPPHASAQSGRRLHNAVLYTALSSRSSGDVQLLLRSFARNFLAEWPYPMVIFYQASDAAAESEAKAAVLELARSYRGLPANRSFLAHQLTYGDSTAPSDGYGIEGGYLPFPLRLWGVPDLFLLHDPAAAAPPEARRGTCSLRLLDLLAFEVGYDWLWYVDPGSTLTGPLAQDAFAEMERRGARYGYAALEDNDEPQDGAIAALWDKGVELARRFWEEARRLELEEAALSVAPLYVPGASGALLFRWPRGRALRAGGVISHASVWSSPATRTIMQHFCRSPPAAAGLSPAEDATARTVAVLASVTHIDELRELTDLPYFDPSLRHSQNQQMLALGSIAAATRGTGVSPVQLSLVRPHTQAGSASRFTVEWLPPTSVIRMQPVGWVGGDLSTSLVLPMGATEAAVEPLQQRLWLFGDTALGGSKRGRRSHLDSAVRQSVGRAPAASSAASGSGFAPSIFEWASSENAEGELLSADVFPCKVGGSSAFECFYIPLAGLAVLQGKETRLVVLAERVQRSSGGKNSTEAKVEQVQSTVIVVNNPSEHASLWQWRAKSFPGRMELNSFRSLSAASGEPFVLLQAQEPRVEKSEDFVYLLGEQPLLSGRGGGSPAAGVFLARARAADLLALQLEAVEVLVEPAQGGKRGKWRPIAEDGGASAAMAPGVAAAELFEAMGSMSSMLWSPELRLWLTAGLITDGSEAKVAVRAAKTPEAPWSPAAAIAPLPLELAVRGDCHGATLHKASPGLPLVAASFKAPVATATISLHCGGSRRAQGSGRGLGGGHPTQKGDEGRTAAEEAPEAVAHFLLVHLTTH